MENIGFTTIEKVGKATKLPIRTTQDYNRFVMLNGDDAGEWNRPISTSHVNDLKESMGRIGYMSHCPIIVFWDSKTGILYIIDGQHRFVAAKELNIEFTYIVFADKHDAMKLTHDLNRGIKEWNDRNYIHSFAQTGNEAYEEIESLSLDYGVTRSVAYQLLAGCIGRKDRNKIRSGTFEVKNKSFAVRVARMLNRLALQYGLKKHRNSPALVSAVSKMCFVKGFSEEILYKKMDNGSIPGLRVCSEDYLKMFDDIYNHHAHGERFRLAELAQHEADKRNPARRNNGSN